MAKKPFQDKSKANEFNPEGLDYTGDRKVNAEDNYTAQKDSPPYDGKVTKAEEAKWQQAQQVTTTETQLDSEGRPIKTTTKVGSGKPVAEEPKVTQASLGLSDKFLKRFPGVAKVLERAIAEGWTQDKFNNEIERETDFAKSRTDAQEAFVIQLMGDKREDLLDAIDKKAKEILQDAASAGVEITEQQANAYARNMARNGLTDIDLRGWIANKAVVGDTVTGRTSELQDGLTALAQSYGQTLTPTEIQTLVRQGLASGDSTTTWLEGQRDRFRESAKLQYPAVADKLDTLSLGQLASGYLSDASEILGIDTAQMSLTDPKWTKALGGKDSAPMTKQEWIATLKTDKTYGYAQTTQAKNEAVAGVRGFLRAMGLE